MMESRIWSSYPQKVLSRMAPSGQIGMMIGEPIWAKAGNATTASRRIIRILFIDSEVPWFPCPVRSDGRSPR